MLFRHSMSITQQLIPIYNTIMYKNKINVALNLMCLTWVSMKTPTGHKVWNGLMAMANSDIMDKSMVLNYFLYLYILMCFVPLDTKKKKDAPEPMFFINSEQQKCFLTNKCCTHIMSNNTFESTYSIHFHHAISPNQFPLL